MRSSELIRSYVFRPSLFVPLFLGCWLLVVSPVLASELDVTVVVPPGADFVDYPILTSSVIDATLDPLHGDLILSSGNARFEPHDSFWEVGSDITHLSLIFPTAIHRIRWVVGETETDGPYLSLEDPCTSPCVPWQVFDDPANPIWFGTGVLGGNAAKFEFDPDHSQSLKGDIGGAGSGGSTTTTSDFQVVLDDIEINRSLLTGEIVPFYSVSDGVGQVASLETRWSGYAWEIRAVTASAASTPWVAINREVNDVRLVRWTEGFWGGVRLRVNDVQSPGLSAPPRPLSAAETHELLMDTHFDDAARLQLQFEEPTIWTSETLTFEPVSAKENFSAGLGSWNNMGVLAALGTQAQTLPGSGLEYRVDLGEMNPTQSAYLEKGAVGVPSVDADGWGFRFWIDPSALTLEQGTVLSVMVGCKGIGPCSQLRTRLDQTATGWKIVTTAADGQGGVAWLESPLSNEPHLVELRFRTAAYAGSNDGLVELRVDGDLKGRATDLQNYDHPIGQVRLGALGVPANASGLIAFDTFESWRFD